MFGADVHPDGSAAFLVGEAAVSRIFREEYGRSVASLIRAFGDIDAAEDAVQEAFAVALRKWPGDGLPPNPGGWITTTARNLAIDRQRREARGRELAVMVFGAAAWKVAARDQFIGWSDRQRVEGLGWLANQQRFLILPWVQVLHLASHLLALATRRLSGDWQSRYGHRIWLVETFLEQERFAATSYKAAGWTEVGQTTGRTRQDRQRMIQTPIKSVWLRPLHSGFRTALTAL